MVDIQKDFLKQQKKQLEKKLGQSLGKVETQVRSSADQVQKQVKQTVSSLTWKIYVAVIFLTIFGVLIPNSYYINQEWERAVETRTDPGVFIYHVYYSFTKKWQRAVETKAVQRFIRVTGPGLHLKLPFIEKYQQYRIDLQRIHINKVKTRTTDVKERKADDNKDEQKNKGYEIEANIVLLYRLPKEEKHLRNLHYLKYKKEDPIDFKKAIETMLTNIFKAIVSNMEMKQIPKERNKITQEVLETLKLFKDSDFKTEELDEMLQQLNMLERLKKIEHFENVDKKINQVLLKVVKKMLETLTPTSEVDDFKDKLKNRLNELFQEKSIAKEVWNILKLIKSIELKNQSDKILTELVQEKQYPKEILEIVEIIKDINFKGKIEEILTELLNQKPVKKEVLKILKLLNDSDFKEKLESRLTELFQEKKVAKELETLILSKNLYFKETKETLENRLTELFQEKTVVNEVLDTFKLLQEISFKEKVEVILTKIFQEENIAEAKEVLKTLKLLKGSHFKTIELYNFSMPYYDWSEEFLRDIRQSDSKKDEILAEQKAQQKYIDRKEKIEEQIKIAQTKADGNVRTIKAQSEACFNTSTAKTEAEIKNMTADANAYAICLKGKAQAAVIQARAHILATNPKWVEFEKMKRWDGKLPDCQNIQEIFPAMSQASSDTLLTILLQQPSVVNKPEEPEKFDETLCVQFESKLTELLDLSIKKEKNDEKEDKKGNDEKGDKKCDFTPLQQLSVIKTVDEEWCVNFPDEKEPKTLCCPSD
jgi:hypothetical protein